MSYIPKHVIVIGGGFAGINFVKHLANDHRYIITLLDKNNYNQFTPLVYQVATGFLEPTNITYPFRRYLRDKSTVRFQLGELTGIYPEQHQILSGNTRLRYDYLVITSGSISNYFGNAKVKASAVALKTVEDALNMRNSLLEAFEQASHTHDPELRNTLLTIVVAGAGPTGVEVAGMLGEMREKIIRRDYPEFSEAIGELYLIDGANAVLQQMATQSQREARAILEKLGVKLIFNAIIEGFENGEVALSNGTKIKTANLIWCAGVTGVRIPGVPETCFGKNNRLLVDSFHKVSGLPDVYAAGDISLQLSDLRYPGGHPQLAQPAIQQGRHLAQNFKAMADGRALIPFQYRNKGVMAIVGKAKAVVDLTKPALHLKGIAGLIVWLLIHVYSLISWNNRLKTLITWLITYLTKDQSLRLLIWTRGKSNEKTSPTL